jgi:hypothetical protein
LPPRTAVEEIKVKDLRLFERMKPLSVMNVGEDLTVVGPHLRVVEKLKLPQQAQQLARRLVGKSAGGGLKVVTEMKGLERQPSA